MRVRVNPVMPPRSAEETGAAAVEMALVTPLLILLLFAITAFGLLLVQDNQLGNGAREGARLGAADPSMACNDGSAQGVVGRTVRAAVGLAPVADDELAVDVFVARTGETLDQARDRGAVCSLGAESPVPVCHDHPQSDRVLVRVRSTQPLIVPLGPVDDDFQLVGSAVFPCQY